MSSKWNCSKNETKLFLVRWRIWSPKIKGRKGSTIIESGRVFSTTGIVFPLCLVITTCHSSIETSRPFQFLYSQILQTSEQNSMAWDEIKFVWNWSYSPSCPTSSRICVYLPAGEYKEFDLNSVNFSHFSWRFTWFINHVDICSLLVPMLVIIQDHTALLTLFVPQLDEELQKDYLARGPYWGWANILYLTLPHSLSLKYLICWWRMWVWRGTRQQWMKEKIQLVLFLKFLCSRNWACYKS